MKAVGYYKSLSIENADVLVEFIAPEPTPGPRDLLVEVRAVSVNPVDTKMRMRSEPQDGKAAILGWDAAGVVKAVGADVTLFAPGDAVWYAGAIDRPGCNSELHMVDERIVGRQPASLSFAEAAAMPLSAITAWEMLFDRLGVARDGGAGQNLLITGGAGGVGSILIQLARQLTKLTVIATASRRETAVWCKELGAHHVIDHSKPLAAQLAAIGAPQVEMIAALTATDTHAPAYMDIIAPQGRICVIDDPKTLDIMPFKRKSVSLHWEFMYTRSLFQTPDMIEQHNLLNELTRLVEEGVVKTTFAEHFGTINAANLKRAHALIESGRAKGKIVLEGF
ncbi:MAG: zinc-binding alcohol dehydrogenase family protein [Hyphomicrobiales bacterium]|nr:zinc-binding alcohol dehydrogenase family protein [Hyphomicrobiales bacterium]